MELVEPSIPTSYRKCIASGVSHIFCYPLFLSRGRHVQEDIPEIVQSVAESFPNVTYILLPHLGSARQSLVEIVSESITSTIKTTQ